MVTKKGCRTKGSSFENMVVKAIREMEIEAFRVPLSGACEDFKGDVLIGDKYNPDFVMENKNQESISKKLWEWIEPHDLLAVKRNFKEPLVIMRLPLFIKFLKDHYERRIQESKSSS